MRHFSVLFIVFTVLFTTNVAAEESTSSGKTKPPFFEKSYRKKFEDQELRQQKYDAFKERKDELASRAALFKESLKNKRLTFKEKLAEFKDSKKGEIVERVDNKIDKLNSKYTDRMSRAVERMNSILGKLEDKTASASSAGKDTASASAALSVARTAVANAQTAVSEQSAKDYAPTITDEETVGSVVSESFSTFHSDIKKAHQLVMDAKEAVKKAARLVLLLSK